MGKTRDKSFPSKVIKNLHRCIADPQIVQNLGLTEVAGEGGPHLAPQKFLLSQKFRHLMG